MKKEDVIALGKKLYQMDIKYKMKSGTANALKQQFKFNDDKAQKGAETYCATNSIFISLAAMGQVKPSVETYKKFIQYASDNGYMKKENGEQKSMDKLLADYGVSMGRTRGSAGWGKYNNMLDTAQGGEVAIVRGSGHSSVSYFPGDGTDVAADTGYYNNSSAAQTEKGTKKITERNFEYIINLKKEN